MQKINVEQIKTKTMTLVKYSDLDFGPTTYNNLVDSFLNGFGNTDKVSKFRPGADVVETEKSYEIHVAVPGMKKDEITVDLNDGLLSISGERNFEKEVEGRNYHTVETRFGKFLRTFNVPDHVDGSKIKASYKDGILKVELPKDENKVLKTTVVVK